jgi:alkylation response protein AidB-like acyl-CoA dehydrogenase
VGPQRRQDLDHNGGIADVHVVVAAVDPELKARGQASFVVGPDFKGKGLSQGQKFQKHGIRASHTSEVLLDDLRLPGSALLGGKDKLDERLARARERAAALARGEKIDRTRVKGGQAAMATFEASRPAVGAQAVGIAGPPTSTRWSTPRPASSSAARSSRTRHRLHARRHEDQARRQPAAVWRAAWMGKNNIPFTRARAR